jgi:hypothetical protein
VLKHSQEQGSKDRRSPSCSLVDNTAPPAHFISQFHISDQAQVSSACLLGFLAAEVGPLVLPDFHLPIANFASVNAVATEWNVDPNATLADPNVTPNGIECGPPLTLRRLTVKWGSYTAYSPMISTSNLLL